MSRRKTYLTNFSTDSLFVVLEQNIMQLQELETKKNCCNDNSLLIDRINQIKLTIEIAKEAILSRYLAESLSIMKVAKMLINSSGTEEMIYRELLTIKLLKSDEPISIELLEKAIVKLNSDQLMYIILVKKGTIYGEIALDKYDLNRVDLEEDVAAELEQKIRADEENRKNEYNKRKRKTK